MEYENNYKQDRKSRISHRIMNPNIESELRKSINQRQEEIQSHEFQEVKIQFLKSFAAHNLKPNDSLIPGNYWFINQKTSKQSVQEINQIIATLKQQYQKFSVDQFVDKIIEKIKKLKLQYTNIKILQKQSLDNKEQVEQIIVKLQQLNLLENENEICIFYIDEIQYKTPLFDFYRIKYMAGLSGDKIQPTSPQQVHSDQKVQSRICKIPQFSIEKHKFINFYIQGILQAQQKPGQSGTINIAEIKLPVKELFLWIDPESFLNMQLDQIYLIVDYVDQTGNTNWTGQNDIELGFFLKLDKQSRITALKQLQQIHDEEIKEMQNKVNEINKQLEILVSPFGNDIHYQTKKNDSHNSNDSCINNCSQCSIF